MAPQLHIPLPPRTQGPKPPTVQPGWIMDDDEMMRLFKKFHIVTAGTRVLELINDSDYDDMAFRDILVEMLRAQEAGYIQRTSQKRLKAACFVNPMATMANVTNNPPQDLSPQRLKRLTATEWITGPEPKNLVVIGPTGSGKSFLIQAIAHNACMHLPPRKILALGGACRRNRSTTPGCISHERPGKTDSQVSPCRP